MYIGFYLEIRSGNKYVAVAAENVRRTGALGVSDRKTCMRILKSRRFTAYS